MSELPEPAPAAQPGTKDPRLPVEAGMCLRCGAAISSMGVERFRTGGTSGGWKLVFGEWAELGEGMLDLEVLACPSCGHVELRVPRP